ncbi:MAG TPA: hypothetical protein VLM40_23845 [Gemmata sp.]|nr:hypothetical protein [Gemmata sp.]
MPQLEQMLAVATQLAGHLRRGGRLGDAAEDQQQLGRRSPDPLEGCPGEGVEDAAAEAALKVEDRVTMPAVDAEPVASAAPRAGQAVGVQQGEERLVTGPLVHQIDQGEVHGRDSRSPWVTPSTKPPDGAFVKSPSTGSAS